MPIVKDGHKRSIVKAITWRILAIIVLVIVSWLITHNWKEVTLITIVFHLIQIVLYYFHERIWNKTSWGKYIE